MPTTVTLWPTTSESLEVDITTDADPTATAPQFGISPAGGTQPSSAWVQGQWTTSWSDGKTTARTPLLGPAAQLVIASGASYLLWIRVTLGGEVAVWPVGSIRVP